MHALTWHDGTATAIELTDATHRTVDLLHFAGSGLMSIHLQRTRHREIRVDARLAAELAQVFDHFARHEQLPQKFPRHEYDI